MSSYWNRLSSLEKIFLVLKILLIILFLAFVVKNWQETTIHFLFFKVTMPLTLVLLLCAVLGAIITSIWYGRKIKSKNQRIGELTDRLMDRASSSNPTNQPLV